MRQQIASAVQLVIQQSRMSDGTRKVTSISEITGMEGDVITMQEIFAFEKLGVTPEGKVIGRFRATGVRPEDLRAPEVVRHPSAARHVRRRDGGAVMLYILDRASPSSSASPWCSAPTSAPPRCRAWCCSASSIARLQEISTAGSRGRDRRQSQTLLKTAQTGMLPAFDKIDGAAPAKGSAAERTGSSRPASRPASAPCC